MNTTVGYGIWDRDSDTYLVNKNLFLFAPVRHGGEITTWSTGDGAETICKQVRRQKNLLTPNGSAANVVVVRVTVYVEEV